MLKLFSVDDHIVEPADVWSKRVPAKYKDRAPHVVERDGRQTWEWEGGSEQTMGLNAVAGKPREQWGMEPTRFEDMIPGCYDPNERARDFLSQGIFASLAFPTLPGFGGRKFETFADKDLAYACVRAWNDFIFDEWCAAEPEMFVPMTVAPVWDVDLCVVETTRTIERGAKALCWIENPANLGLPGYHTDYWEPLFALCQEAELPICMHIGGASPQVSLEGFIPMVRIASAFTMAAESAVNLMCSHLPRKYPDVKLVWSEGGIGWITAALERADRQWDRHRYWTHVPDADILPSEVARKNMWFCMIEEPIGIRYRYDYTVDHILWESDYPHADTPFPNTQASVKEQFETVPADEVAMMTHKNAESLFKFPLSDGVINRYSGG